jgi:hypothetical protein
VQNIGVAETYMRRVVSPEPLHFEILAGEGVGSPADEVKKELGVADIYPGRICVQLCLRSIPCWCGAREW